MFAFENENNDRQVSTLNLFQIDPLNAEAKSVTGHRPKSSGGEARHSAVQVVDVGENEDGWTDDEIDSAEMAELRQNRVAVLHTGHQTSHGPLQGTSIDVTTPFARTSFQLFVFLVTNGLLVCSRFASIAMNVILADLSVISPSKTCLSVIYITMYRGFKYPIP